MTVVETLPRLLSRVATGELAAFYADLHRGRGVDLRLGQAVAGFRGDGGAVRAVTLADGSEVPADLVVVGIGIEPVTDLARAAGLDCDNGIAVDAGCRTSAPDVFAAGDCTSHPNAYLRPPGPPGVGPQRDGAGAGGGGGDARRGPIV